MKKIDLHIHSEYSDGTNSVEELLALVKKNDITFFSITDHNFISPAVKQIQEEAKKQNINFLQGVEISCVDRETGQSIHMLGYSTDFDIVRLNQILEPVISGYNERAKKIISKINQKYNTGFDFDEIKSKIKSSYVSQNLLADKLATYLGRKISRKEALQEVFVEEDNSWMPDVLEAIEIIQNNRGKAFLAHPGNLKEKIDFEKFLNKLKTRGLTGMEIYYPKHDAETIGLLKQASKKYGLLTSGGSDWHGAEYSDYPMGIQVTDAVYQQFLTL